MVNSQFVTDLEIIRWLRDEYLALLVALGAKNEDFFVNALVRTSTVTDGPQFDATSGTLPMRGLGIKGDTEDIDVWKHFGIEVNVDPALSLGSFRRLKRIEFSEAHRYGWGSGQTGDPRYYYIHSGVLGLLPIPSGDMSYRWYMIYVGEDGWETGPPYNYSFNYWLGWDSVLVYGAAAKAIAKQQEDPSVMLMERDRYYAIAEQYISDRDMGAARRVFDAGEGDHFDLLDYD